MCVCYFRTMKLPLLENLVCNNFKYLIYFLWMWLTGCNCEWWPLNLLRSWLYVRIVVWDPLCLGKWELWEHDRIHCRSREVLLCAVSCTHVWCVWEQYRMMGESVLRCDAVTRAMMWVVTRHMHGRGVYVCGCIALNSCFACSYCDWAEMSFLQVP